MGRGPSSRLASPRRRLRAAPGLPREAEAIGPAAPPAPPPPHLLVPDLERLAADAVQHREEPALERVLEHAGAAAGRAGRSSPAAGAGAGATALRKDTADLPRIPPRLRPALPGRGGSAAVTRELLSAPAGCRRIYFRPLLRERGVTGARVAVATGLGGAGPGGRRRRRRPRAGAGGAGPGGRRRRPRAGAGRAGWRGPPSLRHSGAAPWGGRRRPRAGPGWSVPACRALRLATGVERWRTRPCRGLRRTPWSARLASTPGTRRRCWLPLAPGVEVPARR